jgi:hypothetical protein
MIDFSWHPGFLLKHVLAGWGEKIIDPAKAITWRCYFSESPLPLRETAAGSGM